jgi:DNA-binding transcriptional regulator YiaG
MTPTQFRAALDRLGLSQVRAATIFGVTDRASRSWALGENKIPHAVAVLLRLLVTGKITIADCQSPSAPARGP